MTHVTICIRGVVIPSGNAYDEDLYILQQHLCMRSIYNTGVCVGDFGIENVLGYFSSITHVTCFLIIGRPNRDALTGINRPFVFLLTFS